MRGMVPKKMLHCAKNVQHGAKNVQHDAENVQHGAKNVRHGAENVQNGAEHVRPSTPKIPQDPNSPILKSPDRPTHQPTNDGVPQTNNKQ